MDLLGSGSLVHPGLSAGPFTDLGLGLDPTDHHHAHHHGHHQQVHHHYNSHFYHPAYSTANQPLPPHRPFTPITSQPPGPTLTPNSGVSQPNYSPISTNAVTSTSVKIKSGKLNILVSIKISIPRPMCWLKLLPK